MTARDGCAVLVCYLLLAPVESSRPLAWAWCCPVILPASDFTLSIVPDAADFLNPLVSRINESRSNRMHNNIICSNGEKHHNNTNQSLMFTQNVQRD